MDLINYKREGMWTTYSDINKDFARLGQRLFVED